MLPLLLALLTGCFSERVECDAPEQVVAEAGDQELTCGEAEMAIHWIELLAARPVKRQRARALAGVAESFEDDPAGTRAWLRELSAAREKIVVETGFEGAEARAHAVWEHSRERGLVRPEHGKVWTAADTTIAVWNTHDEDELALTEADIEAWILYGSLCRQMQSAGVLRISVADRVNVYNTIAERWKFGSRSDRIALASFGPFWADVKDTFNAAPYEKQQEWGRTAPLPPPMTATSLGYLSAILEGDLVGHVSALHGTLGPFSMGR